MSKQPWFVCGAIHGCGIVGAAFGGLLASPEKWLLWSAVGLFGLTLAVWFSERNGRMNGVSEAMADKEAIQ